jgi:alkylation response protein AidB-like acyl-CoA dehydrogenase
MTVLAQAGALGRCGSISQEWELVRAVAQADGSVGRIVDGHHNAVERIELLAGEPLRSTHLEEVAAGRRWLGVWGADPAPGEGEPARVVRDGGELRLEGVKTFCSGAGGLHGALVVARDGDARRVAYVDLSEGVEIDRSWFAAAGMRASESHLVRFHGARVHALLGGPDELLRDPWFGRDAIRTAATWAGIADAARAAALEALAPRALAGDDSAALAVGRIDTHAQTIDLWLAEAGRRADAHPDAAMRTLSVHLREAVARAAQALVDEALRAAGSRPLARGGALDRAARDLRVFLLQHRLDPLLVRAGREAVGEVAARRDLLERLAFPVGYGVEIAMLLDAERLVGLNALAQADLGSRQNRHQPLDALLAMSYAVLVAACKRLLGPEAVDALAPGPYVLPGAGDVDVRQAPVEERPPHVGASRPHMAGTAPA